MSTSLAAGVHPPKRHVAAWAAWDWGSAAFNAVITTFVFSVYLTSNAFGGPDRTQIAVFVGTAVAAVVVAAVAPVTGQAADRSGRSTMWLGIHTTLVVLVSALMVTVRPDPAYLWWGIALLALGNIFFEFASVTYNGMLHRVSTPATVGRVSGIGWGAGYVGGIVLLLLLLVGFIRPEVGWFGVTSADSLNIRAAVLFSAVWFALFAVPVLLVLRDDRRAVHDHAPRLGVLGSYRALFATIRGLATHHRPLLMFLIASAVFRDGLAGVFASGGVIAQNSFGFSPGQVIVFGVVANVVAGLATIAFGFLDDRFGPKRLIVWSLVAMIVTAVGIFLFHSGGTTVFWVLGLMLCVFVGPCQSASRSLLSRYIPEGREGEIFGLYAMTGRAVSFLAPALFAGFTYLGGLVTAGSAPHWGILGIVVVLLLGLLLLLPVRPPVHHRASADPAAV